MDGSKCGVAILFNNTFKYKLHKTISDPFGRYIIINISTQNQKITLVTLYGPNTDSPEFFLNLKETICANDLLDNAIILCGDWNVVQNYTMDTVNYTRQNNPKAQEAVFQLTGFFELFDIFRMQNPESRRYTWRAVRNGQLKQARLDYFLVSSDVTNFVHSIETLAGYRTDHSIVIINLVFSEKQRGRGFWKFNNSLLYYDSEYVNRVKKCIKETVEDYKIHGDAHSPESIRFSIDDQLFFETLKLQIRGTTIPYAAGKKRERIRQEKQIEEEINILQKDVDEKHSPETNNKLKSKQMELQKIREYKMKGILTRSRVNWGAKGEKNSKHFLSLERRNYTNKVMTKLILDNNEEITSQEDVIKE